MTVSQRLGKDIDQLAVPRRMARLASYALAADPSELAQVVADWSTAGPFYQRLAIHLATVARRCDLLEPLVDDPVVGPSAIVQLTRLGAASGILARLDDLPLAHRRAFYKAVRGCGLADAADAAIGPVRARFGAAEAARIVGACSPQVAATHLPGLIHLVGAGGQPSITRLARQAPDLVGAALAEYVHPLPADATAGQLVRRAALLVELARLRPKLVAALLDVRLASMVHTWELRPVLNAMARSDAAATVALLRQTPADVDRLMTRPCARALARHGAADDLVRWLWQSGKADGHAAFLLLRAIAPRRRPSALGAETLAAMPASTPQVVALLPVPERHQCARTWLRRQAGARVTDRQSWLGLLPVADNAEARELTRSPDPGMRRLGYGTLLTAAFGERSPQVVDRVLSGLTRLTHEQDPVRCAVAATLCRGLRARGVPASTRAWLQGFVTAVCQARDTSTDTTDFLSELVVSTLDDAVLTKDDAGVSWALDQLDRLLATQTGRVCGVRDLSRQAIDALAPRLLPWLQRWPVDRRMRQIRALHELRRPQLWDLTAPFLRHLALQAGDGQAGAIALYLDDPRHRDARVAEVVAATPSAGYLPECADVLARRRTDLLDPYLNPAPAPGPFGNATSFFVAGRAIRGWLPRQQRASLDALGVRAFATKDLPVRWARAARMVADADGAPTDRLDGFLTSSDAAVQAAGLAALSGVWPPDTAATRLLGDADTDRAPAAMYSLMPALRRLPPDRVVELARPFLLGDRSATVTSLKALVRCVEQTRVPDAVGLLAEVLARPGLHRDVAQAVTSVLTRHLDDPVAEAAVAALADDDPALGGALQAYPLDLSAAARPVFGRLVVRLMRSADRQVRWLAWEWYPEVAVWAPHGNAVIIERLLRPDWDEWHRARELGSAAGRGVVDGVVDVCARLARQAQAEFDSDDRPSREADLPSLRRLEAVLTAWWRVRQQPVPALAALREVGAALAATEVTRGLAVQALASAAFAVLAPQVADDLLTDALAACDPWLGVVVGPRLAQWATGCDPADVLRAITPGCATPAAGLFVETVSRCGRAAGWTQPWAQLLASLRRHADPGVRAAACAVDASGM